ncbi:MAG: 4Fe-4S binding protein [Candidatus Omnitrophota bacterium]
MKTGQGIMIWLLPLVTAGGLFFPLLGFAVLGMMVFFLTLAFFKNRYWCWNLCPRGAFLDIVMSRLSPKKPMPKVLTTAGFRIGVFSLVLPASFIVWKLIHKENTADAVGAAFVAICLTTTIAAVILAVFTKPRAWCVICPMGNLQGKIYQSVNGKR